MSKWLPTLSMIFASGCATIVSKSEYDIQVSCNSPRATVNVYKSGELVNSFIAPAVITLSSKGGYFCPASYRFEFVKGSGRDVVELDAAFDWWYLGNFILPYGIVVALTVDPMTGAMWKFDDDASVCGQIDFAGEEPSIGLSKVLGDASKNHFVQPLMQTNSHVAVSATKADVYHAEQDIVSPPKRDDSREANSISEPMKKKYRPKVWLQEICGLFWASSSQRVLDVHVV